MSGQTMFFVCFAAAIFAVASYSLTKQVEKNLYQELWEASLIFCFQMWGQTSKADSSAGLFTSVDTISHCFKCADVTYALVV